MARLIAIRGINGTAELNINAAAHIHLYGSEDHRMRELHTFICKWSRPVFDLPMDDDSTEPMDMDDTVAVKGQVTGSVRFLNCMAGN